MTTVTQTATNTDQQIVDIGAGQVPLDELISTLLYFKETAEQKMQEIVSTDNQEFQNLLKNSTEETAKAVAQRVVLRNSVKRDIARRLAEELMNNQTFMDQLGRTIIDLNARQVEAEQQSD